jgi:hypothetical protein
MVSAVICPSCRAQNRPNWEYCPRCGEALEGAATQVTSRQQTLTGIRAPEETPRDAGTFYLLLMGVASRHRLPLHRVSSRSVAPFRRHRP